MTCCTLAKPTSAKQTQPSTSYRARSFLCTQPANMWWAVQESMAQEGVELAKASFGPTILLAIGKAYEGQAAIYLGGFFQGGLISLRQDAQGLKSKVHLGMMGLKVFQAQQKLEQMDKDQKQRAQAQGTPQQPQSPTSSGIPAANLFSNQEAGTGQAARACLLGRHRCIPAPHPFSKQAPRTGYRSRRRSRRTWAYLYMHAPICVCTSVHICSQSSPAGET